MPDDRKIKVCFWTTTFQGDVWSVVKHLAQDPDFELLVAVDDPTDRHAIFRHDDEVRQHLVNTSAIHKGEISPQLPL